MPNLTESNRPAPSTRQLVESALEMLKQNVEQHIERGNQLERLYLGWQQSWQWHFDELQFRIEKLESRVVPRLAIGPQCPQLSLISHQEDVA